MSRSYCPIQEFEGKQLSVDLLDKPEDFYMHNRRYSASVIMQVVYGHRIPECTPLLPAPYFPFPSPASQLFIFRGLRRNPSDLRRIDPFRLIPSSRGVSNRCPS